MDEIAITLTTQGQQTATQTASWSDFLLNTVNELSEEEQVISGANQMIRKLQQQGQISVAKMCYLSILSAHRYPESDRPHLCAGECTFMIASSQLCRTPTADPENKKIGTFIFRSFLVFEMFQLPAKISLKPLSGVVSSLLNSDAKYLPCMNYNFIESRFSFKRMFESIISYASRLTINRTMAA